MVGQMLMVGFRGTGDDMNADDLPIILRQIRAGRVGGVVLFDYDPFTKTFGQSRNVRSPATLRKLTAALQQHAPIPLFIAIDQEGGPVRRLKPDMSMPDTPSAEALAKQGPEAVRAAALAMGHGLKALGINMNFAPVADVAINPASPAIGARGRAFSGNAHEVARLARLFAEGLSEAGVVPAYKHFPGHGSAQSDTHNMFTDITATWSPDELVPYTQAMRPTVPMVMMTGHLFHKGLDPRFTATLSPAILTGLLRGRLGWEGVILTDDLQMKGLTARYSLREILLHAVEADADMLLNSNMLAYHPDMPARLFDELLALVREGHISQERIERSYRRIMRLKAQSGLLPGKAQSGLL